MSTEGTAAEQFEYTILSHPWSLEEIEVKGHHKRAFAASSRHTIETFSFPAKIFQRPHGSYPTVPGWINGKKVDPLGDSGASHNYVSEAYARRNGYAIEPSDDRSIKLANSKSANVVGSTTLSFRFKHDAQKYDLQFKVLRNCIHDLILGASFLRLTETFTRFKERIKWRLGNIFRPSVNFIDDGAPQQYILGSCNGAPVVALPDTGCQVLLVSERHARAMGYNILRQSQHRIKLELADGSFVYTEGMVKDLDWRFDNDGITYRENFYVLKDLACDVILSCDFVCDTQALENYPHLLFEGDLMDAETQANLNVIKIVRESDADGGSVAFKTGLKSLFSRSRPKQAAASFVTTSTDSYAFERAREALLDEMEDVDIGPANKQAVRRRALDAEYSQQMKTHPTVSARPTLQTTTKLLQKS